VLLDRETTIDLGDGKPVKARLTARPERRFRAGGVSFRYPRHHGFAFEGDADAGLATWTLDGNDNVLILTRYDMPIDEDDLRQSVVEGITSQFARAEHKTETTTLSLGGVRRPAARVRVKLGDASLVQDVCTWRAEGKDGPSYSLIVQDSPPDGAAPGKPSPETARVLKLLDETFKQDGAAPAAAAPPRSSASFRG
jgi:hypothetical protein